MKLIIILDEPYPYGMACTNRIHLYAKALTQNDVETEVLVPKPKFKTKNLKVDREGYYEGVRYSYSAKSAFRSSSFLKRRIDDFYGPIIAAFNCFKAKPDFLLCVGSGYFVTLLLKFVCKQIGCKLILEKSEIPFMKQDDLSFLETSYLKHVYSLFDGVVVITEKLGDFFHKDLNLSLKKITIPILVESHDIKRKIHDLGDYVLYTGSLVDRKDGVLTLLKAFAIFSKGFSAVNLVITGDAESSPDYHKIKAEILKLGVADKIRFTGFVSKAKLVELTLKARLSIVLKPFNRQNSYNFPTKLGEYMVAGCPVLCTRTDVLESIFSNNENIFFTDYEAISIANSLAKIIKNPQHAEKVGAEGKRFARKVFNSNIQMRRFKDFLSSEF